MRKIFQLSDMKLNAIKRTDKYRPNPIALLWNSIVSVFFAFSPIFHLSDNADDTPTLLIIKNCAQTKLRSTSFTLF